MIHRRLLTAAFPSHAALALTIGLAFVGGVVTVLEARILSQIVDRVFLQGHGLAEIAWWPVCAKGRPLWNASLGWLAATIAVRSALAWVGSLAADRLASQVKIRLRRQILDRIVEAGPVPLGQERSGELVNTLGEGVEALDAYFREYLPQLAIAVLVPLTVLALVFPLDWISALILLTTAPLIPLFLWLLGNLANTATRRQWRSLSRMSAHFLDVIQGLPTLKLLGRSREQARMIVQISHRHRRATMDVLRIAFLSALALELLTTLSTALVAVGIGLRLLQGTLPFVDAFFVLLLAPEFYLPLRTLGIRFHAGMAGASAGERILQILDQQPTAQCPPCIAGTSCDTDEGRGPRPLSAGRLPRSEPLGRVSLPQSLGPIRFANVHFSYPVAHQQRPVCSNDRLPALQEISFTLQPDTLTALIGPSGSGKTTLANLLLRFLEPDHGDITVDGRPLTVMSPSAWRTQVAWLPQRPYLFNTTVLANIRLARPAAGLAEVVRAARLAHADQFIADLPKGYQTVVGERGVQISGGQIQRIALARAFLKNAPLVILDEPSAHLDPELEAQIQTATMQLLQGRTSLVIAHRLTTIYQAGQIIVLNRGRIVQVGHHQELVSRPGLYRYLVSASVDAWSAPDVHPKENRGLMPGASVPAAPLRISGHQSSGEITYDEFPPAPADTASSGATLLRLLRFLIPYRGWVALSVLLGFAAVGSAIGLMSTAAYIIARAALQPSIAVLQIPIVGVRFFGIARGVFRYLERYVSHETTFRVLARFRVWFFQALEPLAPARLQDHDSGDLLSHITADVAALEHFYVRVVAPPLVAVFIALAIGWFFARIHILLALAILFFLLLAGIGLPILTHHLSKEHGRSLAATRGALNAALVDTIQGLADLLSAGGEHRQLARVYRLSRRLTGLQTRLAHVNGLQAGLELFLAHSSLVAILALSTPMVMAGLLPGTLLPVLLLAALASFEAVSPLPQAAHHLAATLAAARRLLGLVDQRPQVQDPSHPTPLPQNYDLELRDLTFRYAVHRYDALPDIGEGRGGVNRHTRPILDHVTFSVPEGKHLAIVGPSGAGKSTLVNLLLRFWDFDEGEIRLGGVDIRRLPQDDLRRRFAVVSQSTHVFHATLRDNLLIARPNASTAELDAATRCAHLHDFIGSLPYGYDTIVDEDGARLSGGQRQRLAIARALLQDAPILVLDEATAHLDAPTERDLLASVRDLMAGRTTLTISHRLVGMEAMDEILVLRSGRIVERGTHLQLLRQSGLYHRMYSHQNRIPIP